MNTRTRSTPSGPAIEVTGDLDHHSAPGIRRLLPGLDIGQGRRLVVDLSGLTFCDSAD
ncbi:STAS domain-containing protein [Streptomyces sp. UMAF16]|nr:STAS domain-containing protein [Streptomyces sp. UMAF16]